MGTLSNRNLSGLKPSNLKRAEFVDFQSMGSNVASSAAVDNYLAEVVNFAPGKGNEWNKRPGTKLVAEILLEGFEEQVKPDHSVMWYDDYGLRVYYLKDGYIYNVDFQTLGREKEATKMDWFKYREVYNYNFQDENVDKLQTTYGDYVRQVFDDDENYDQDALKGAKYYDFLVTGTYAIWTIGSKMLYMPVNGGWAGDVSIIGSDTSEGNPRQYLIPYTDVSKGTPFITTSPQSSRRVWFEVASQVQDIFTYNFNGQINYNSERPGHRVETFTPLSSDVNYITIYNDGAGSLKSNLGREYITVGEIIETVNDKVVIEGDKVKVASAYRNYFDDKDAEGAEYPDIRLQKWFTSSRELFPENNLIKQYESDLEVIEDEETKSKIIKQSEGYEKFLTELRESKGTKSVKSLLRKHKIKDKYEIIAAERFAKNLKSSLDGYYRQVPHFRTILFQDKAQDEKDTFVSIRRYDESESSKKIRQGKDDAKDDNVRVLTTADFIELGITNQDAFFQYLLDTGHVISNEDGSVQMSALDINLGEFSGLETAVGGVKLQEQNSYQFDNTLYFAKVGPGGGFEVSESKDKLQLISATAPLSGVDINDLPGAVSIILDGKEMLARVEEYGDGHQLIVYSFDKVTGRPDVSQTIEYAMTEIPDGSLLSNTKSITQDGSLLFITTDKGIVVNDTRTIFRDSTAFPTNRRTIRTYGLFETTSTLKDSTLIKAKIEDYSGVLVGNKGNVLNISDISSNYVFEDFDAENPNNELAWLAFDPTVSTTEPAEKITKGLSEITDIDPINAKDIIINQAVSGTSFAALEEGRFIYSDNGKIVESRVIDTFNNINLFETVSGTLKVFSTKEETNGVRGYELSFTPFGMFLAEEDFDYLDTQRHIDYFGLELNTLGKHYVLGTYLVILIKEKAEDTSTSRYSIFNMEEGFDNLNFGISSASGRMERLLESLEIEAISSSKDVSNYFKEFKSFNDTQIPTDYLYYNRSWLMLSNDRFSETLGNLVKGTKPYATVPIFGETNDIDQIGFGVSAGYGDIFVHQNNEWLDLVGDSYEDISSRDINKHLDRLQALQDGAPGTAIDLRPMPENGGKLDEPLTWGFKFATASWRADKDELTSSNANSTESKIEDDWVSTFTLYEGDDNDLLVDGKFPEMLIRLNPLGSTEPQSTVVAYNSNPYSLFDTFVDDKFDQASNPDTGIDIGQTVRNYFSKTADILLDEEKLTSSVKFNLHGIIMCDGENIALDITNLSTKSNTEVYGPSKGFNKSIAEGLGNDVSRIFANNYQQTEGYIYNPDKIYEENPSGISYQSWIYQPNFSEIAVKSKINSVVFGPSVSALRNNLTGISSFQEPDLSGDDLTSAWQTMLDMKINGDDIIGNTSIVLPNDRYGTGASKLPFLFQNEFNSMPVIGGLNNIYGFGTSYTPYVYNHSYMYDIESSILYMMPYGHQISPRPIQSDEGPITSNNIEVTKIKSNFIQGRIHIYDDVSGETYFDSGYLDPVTQGKELTINFRSFIDYMRILGNVGAKDLINLPIVSDIELVFNNAEGGQTQIKLNNKDYVNSVLIGMLERLAEGDEEFGILDLTDTLNTYELNVSLLQINTITGEDLVSIDWYYRQALSTTVESFAAYNATGDELQVLGLVSQGYTKKIEAANIREDVSEPLTRIVPSIQADTVGSSKEGTGTYDSETGVVSFQAVFNSSSFDKSPYQIFSDFFDVDTLADKEPFIIRTNNLGFLDARWQYGIIYDNYISSQAGDGIVIFNITIPVESGIWLEEGKSYSIPNPEDPNDVITSTVEAGDLMISQDNLTLVSSYIQTRIALYANDTFPQDIELSMKGNNEIVSISTYDDKIVVAYEDQVYVSASLDPSKFVYRLENIPTHLGKIIKTVPFYGSIMIIFEKGYCTYSPEYTTNGTLQFVTPYNIKVSTGIINGNCITLNPESIDVLTTDGVKRIWNYNSGGVTQIPQLTEQSLSKLIDNKLLADLEKAEDVSMFTHDEDVYVNFVIYEEGEDGEIDKINKLYIYTSGRDLLAQQPNKWYVWEGPAFDVRQMETFRDNEDNLTTYILPKDVTEVYQLGYEYNLYNEGNKTIRVEGHLDRAIVKEPLVNNAAFDVTTGQFLAKQDEVTGITIESTMETNALGSGNIYDAKWKDYAVILNNFGFAQTYYRKHFVLDNTTGQFIDQNVQENVYEVVDLTPMTDSNGTPYIAVQHNKPMELDIGLEDVVSINTLNTKAIWDSSLLYTTVGGTDELNIEDKVALGSAKASQFKIVIKHYDDKPFAIKKLRTTLKLKKHK